MTQAEATTCGTMKAHMVTFAPTSPPQIRSVTRCPMPFWMRAWNRTLTARWPAVSEGGKEEEGRERGGRY